MKNSTSKITLLFLFSIYIGFGQDIVINELNYNSAPDFDPEDWVELYNNSESSVDVSNWVFKDDNDANQFVIPSGTIMNAGTYLVLAKDLAAFQTLFAGVSPVIGDIPFGLSKSGELVRLFDSAGTLIDQLEYDDKDPWPEEPDGDGNSLELINPSFDNTLHTSWAASVTATAPHGTPGEQNSTYSLGTDDLTLSNIDFTISPNPMKDSAIIKIKTDFDLKETYFYIYTILGERIKSIIVESENLEIHKDNLSSGIYICKIVKGNHFIGSRKLIVN
jgi:hypothetical protein